MPIKLKPLTFICGGCDWKKTVAPKSDALKPGDRFSHCPKCGSGDLSIRRATGWEKLWIGIWLEN